MLMRNITSTMSHLKGEMMAMNVTYLIKLLPLCTSILFNCSSFKGKQYSSERHLLNSIKSTELFLFERIYIFSFVP